MKIINVIHEIAEIDMSVDAITVQLIILKKGNKKKISQAGAERFSVEFHF